MLCRGAAGGLLVAPLRKILEVPTSIMLQLHGRAAGSSRGWRQVAGHNTAAWWVTCAISSACIPPGGNGVCCATPSLTLYRSLELLTACMPVLHRYLHTANLRHWSGC
jgi:hypothetical protein